MSKKNITSDNKPDLNKYAAHYKNIQKIKFPITF